MNGFGMPTLIELPNMEDCAKLCSEISLQFIELNMCLPQFQVETIDIDKLLKLSKKYNIFYLLNCYDILWRNTSYCPASKCKFIFVTIQISNYIIFYYFGY